MRKSTLAIVALALGATAPALAQRPEGGRGGPPQLERMEALIDTVVTDLQLDQTQEDQFREIMAGDLEKRRAMFESARGDRTAMRELRESMSELDQATDSALVSIFSEDQMNRYRQIRAELMPRGRGNGRPRSFQ